ncbi:MAG TPA: tetratricopeptide repeat protein [Thermoanaerobaculia bacterium]|jgi:tetratricopeptide (TPR) repeat protein
MAQPATNPKIEELRFRLKTDPKSRLFYQLAEELRRAGQFQESEHVLRTGLTVYPAYLAAWVSLGRCLREQKNEEGAVEALTKALQLDPGNVVAARLLADAYLALGDKLEALKKYKLVHALLPADEELRGVIDRLDQELRAPEPVFGGAAGFSPPGEEDDGGLKAAAPQEDAPQEPEPVPESPFDQTLPPFEEAEQSLGEEMRVETETADVEPMLAAHEDSPFEEPAGTADSIAIEAPLGMQIVSAPLAAEVPAFVTEDLPTVDSTPVFDTPEPQQVAETGDVSSTITMADLYARQGLVDDARQIYLSILARDPGNAEVHAKLASITPRANPKVVVLERWLAKVSRREAGSV